MSSKTTTTDRGLCRVMYRTSDWSPYQECGRKAKGMRAGEWMCGIHIRAVDQRRASNERYEANRVRDQRSRERHSASMKVMAFLFSSVAAGAQSVSLSALVTDDDTTTLRNLILAATDGIVQRWLDEGD
jgi:hypothetical protein